MNAPSFSTVPANPAGRAAGWLVSGLALPLVLRAASLAHPIWHDDVILPMLMLVVRPWLWVVWLAGLGLIAFRSENTGGGLAAGSLALGVVLGLMIFNRWWYFDPLWFYLPWCFWLTVVVIVWRLRLLAWAEGSRAAAFVSAAVVVALLGAAFDWSRGLPRWDHRFSPGMSENFNVLFTFGVLAAVGSGLFLWRQKHVADVLGRNRRLLTQIIEDDPRCGAYFEAVTRVTPHGISRAMVTRKAFANVVGPAAGPLADRIFRREDRPVRGGDRQLSDLYWRLKDGMMASGLRFLREHRSGHELPSPYIRALLGEAVEREHGRWLEALGPEKDGDGKTWLDRLPFCLGDQTRIDLANSHFARYLSLQEAQIEAGHLFFMAAPVFDASLVGDWLKEFNEQMTLLRRTAPAKGSSIAPNTTKLPKVAEAYLQLWSEQVDRLFIIHGDQLGHAMEGDRVNFRELTGNLLAARGTPSGFHERAATLALSLFVIEDPTLAGQVAASLQKYYAEDDERRPGWWGQEFRVAEEAEIAIAVSAYMLWLGIQKGWNDDAARPTTLQGFSALHWLAARVSAHVLAASLMAAVRRQRRGMAAETIVGKRWDSYVNLPSPSSDTFTSRVSGDLLAAAFLLHLQRAAKPAVQPAKEGPYA